jgi:hypothetical protein
VNCKIFLVRLWNTNLNESESASLFNNGRADLSGILYKHRWGSQAHKYQSDFSANTDGWGSVRGTSSANNDGISDGAVSKDNVLKYYANSENNLHGVYKAMLTVGKKYRLEFDFYIPSGQTNVDGGMISGSHLNITNGTFDTVGEWSSHSTEFEAGSTTVRIYLTASGNYNFSGANSTGDDIIYLTNIKLWQIGCVAEYMPDNAGSLTWRENANGIHADAANAKQIGCRPQELVYRKTITGDSVISDCVRAGFRIVAILVDETTGNAVTGGINIGTAAAGSQIVSAQAVSGSSLNIDCTLLKRYFSDTNPQTVYVSAVTGWNSASVNLKLILERVV